MKKPYKKRAPLDRKTLLWCARIVRNTSLRDMVRQDAIEKAVLQGRTGPELMLVFRAANLALDAAVARIMAGR